VKCGAGYNGRRKNGMGCDEVSLLAFFMQVQREFVFVKFCSVLSLFLSYYISLSFRCFCSNMCSEKRETSLVMPLQEDHIQSPKLPLDVLSC
jgi:hypothetical protein